VAHLLLHVHSGVQTAMLHTKHMRVRETRDGAARGVQTHAGAARQEPRPAEEEGAPGRAAGGGMSGRLRPDAAGGPTPERGASPEIILAEDDRAFRTLLASALRGCGYTVAECASGSEALEQLGRWIGAEQGGPKLLISDIRMPGPTGLNLLVGIRGASNRTLPTILITGFGDADTHAFAKALGALEIWDKPFEIDSLCASVVRLLGPRPVR